MTTIVAGRGRLVRPLPGDRPLVRDPERPNVRLVHGPIRERGGRSRARGGWLIALASVVAGALAATAILTPREPAIRSETAGVPEVAPTVAHEARPDEGDALGPGDGAGSTAVRQTDDGHVVRWACDAPITVHLAPGAPPGAVEDLTDAVSALAAASGLPLEMAGTSDTFDGEASVITVTYEERTELPGPVLGTGGVSHWPSGEVSTGRVSMRTDGNPYPPRSPEHRRALLHELGHAVGLTHAPEGSEDLMAPTLTSGLAESAAFALGDGDRAALALVGCPR